MAYLITSTISHRREFTLRFWDTVDSVPFDGPSHLESEYRRQLRAFLVHLDHCTNYNRNEDRWTDVKVPIPHTLGKAELPLLFRPSRQLGFTRGIDALHDARVVEWTRPDWKRSKCRMFNIVPNVRLKWYRPERNLDTDNTDLNDYKAMKRDYNPLNTPRGQRPKSLADRIAAAAKRGLTTPRHDLSEIEDQHIVARRYKDALDLLEPNLVDLDALIAHMQDCERLMESGGEDLLAHVARYYGAVAAIDTILARGIKIIKTVPLTVAYRPEYKVAQVGGRLFEVGGGFQTLPNRIKMTSFGRDANYDIKSSQMNILRAMFKKYKIECDFFDDFPSVEHIAQGLGVSKRLAKVVMYGTLFSAGQIRASKESSIFSAMVDELGLELARTRFDRWRELASSLLSALDSLTDRLWHQNRGAVHLTWTNAVGIEFYADEYVRESVSARMRAERQLLAHIVQGHESEFVLQTLEDSDNTVRALEHDGLIGRIEAEPDHLGLTYELKTEWNGHLYESGHAPTPSTEYHPYTIYTPEDKPVARGMEGEGGEGRGSGGPGGGLAGQSGALPLKSEVSPTPSISLAGCVRYRRSSHAVLRRLGLSTTLPWGDPERGKRAPPPGYAPDSPSLSITIM